MNYGVVVLKEWLQLIEISDFTTSRVLIRINKEAETIPEAERSPEIYVPTEKN